MITASARFGALTVYAGEAATKIADSEISAVLQQLKRAGLVVVTVADGNFKCVTEQDKAAVRAAIARRRMALVDEKKRRRRS